MQETGQEAQTAEGDVDQRVSGADASFDPDGDTVGFSQCFVQASDSCSLWRGTHGGKMMASMPRKMSLPHMMFDVEVYKVRVLSES